MPPSHWIWPMAAPTMLCMGPGPNQDSQHCTPAHANRPWLVCTASSRVAPSVAVAAQVLVGSPRLQWQQLLLCYSGQRRSFGQLLPQHTWLWLQFPGRADRRQLGTGVRAGAPHVGVGASQLKLPHPERHSRGRRRSHCWW